MVTLDSTSSGTAVIGLTLNAVHGVFTWNHTLGSGLNRVVLIVVSKTNETNNIVVTSVSGIDSGWVYLGRADRGTDQLDISEIWYLLVPNHVGAGTYGMQVNMSGNFTLALTSGMQAGSISLFGGTTPINFSNTRPTNPSANLQLKTITSTTDGYIVTGWTTDSSNYTADVTGTSFFMTKIINGCWVGAMYSAGSGSTTDNKINTDTSGQTWYGCGCYIPPSKAKGGFFNFL